MGGQKAVGKGEGGVVERGRHKETKKECVKAKCFEKYRAGACRARYYQATRASTKLLYHGDNKSAPYEIRKIRRAKRENIP